MFLYVYNTSRAGQTTSAEKHCQDMWMERRIVEGMIEEFIHARGYDMVPQKTYMKAKLSYYVSRIYYYILLYPRLLQNKELIKFDECVKQCNGIYNITNIERTEIHRLGSVSYISLWRKKQSRCALPFIIYDIQERISMITHKILAARR